MSRNPKTKTTWVFVAVSCALVFGLAYFAQRRLPRGEDASRPEAPDSATYERMVSLAPSITETLFALGLGDKVVGVTRYCDYPPEARSKQNVGGYYDPNYEAILALEPDLVILLPEHEKPREYLKQRGIRTLTVNHKSTQGILESIRRIGDIGGVPERAETLVGDIEKRIETVTRRVKNLPRSRVMVGVGRDIDSGKIADVYIAGNAGWYSELIDMAGGSNAFRGDMAFPSVSAEGILKMNPEVIIEMLGDMSGREFDEKAALKAWNSLPQVAAVREGRVHLFREDFVVIPGPRFVLILEKLAGVLHPEVDWERGEASVAEPADRSKPAGEAIGEARP
jgi:iron complex transport system substrate-binding protein